MEGLGWIKKSQPDWMEGGFAGCQAAAAPVGTWLSHRLPGREEFARHPPTQAENFEVLTESCPWGPDRGLWHSDFHPVQPLPAPRDRGIH